MPDNVRPDVVIAPLGVVPWWSYVRYDSRVEIARERPAPLNAFVPEIRMTRMAHVEATTTGFPFPLQTHWSS